MLLLGETVPGGLSTQNVDFTQVLFEGVWAVHTTVIIAADRREARSELGAALGDPQWDVVMFAHLLRFPTNL